MILRRWLALLLRDRRWVPCDMNYAGKTILITGAGGFLGRHLTYRTAAAGCAVHCVARARPSGAGGNIRFHSVDLRDAGETCALFRAVKPDVVFHFASASGGSKDLDNVLPHLQNDIDTTVNCLVAAQKAGTGRIIIPGSTDEPALGSSTIPDSPYAMAKTTCVNFGKMFHNLYGTPVVICRIFMAYGPGQKSRKVLHYIIRSMLAQEPPQLSSGARMVDWVYIDDTIDALMLSGLASGVEGKTLEIGSGELVSINEIARKVQRLIPNSPPAEAGAEPFYGSVRAADLDAAARYIQWSPKTSLDSGLRATVQWYTADASLEAAGALSAGGRKRE